jgi:ribonuclease Z
VLYHTEDKNISRRKELYTAEGRLYYHGNLYVPDDLECIELQVISFLQ